MDLIGLSCEEVGVKASVDCSACLRLLWILAFRSWSVWDWLPKSREVETGRFFTLRSEKEVALEAAELVDELVEKEEEAEADVAL